MDAFVPFNNNKIVRGARPPPPATTITTNRYITGRNLFHPYFQRPESVHLRRQRSHFLTKSTASLLGVMLLASLLAMALKSPPGVLPTSVVVTPTSMITDAWQLLLMVGTVASRTVPLRSIDWTFFQSGLMWYLRQLQAFPLVTKSITSGLIGICGDCLAQWLEYKMKRRRNHRFGQATVNMELSDDINFVGSYDHRRGLANLADGMFISGPIMHCGYNFFESVLPISGSGSTFAALVHVVLDSVVLDSIFVASAFLATGLMEGYRLRQHIVPQFRQGYVPALKASWATSATLLPVEFICFRFLPVALRTLAVSLTDIVWDAIISLMAHRHRGKRKTWECADKHSINATPESSLMNPIATY